MASGYFHYALILFANASQDDFIESYAGIDGKNFCFI